MTHHPFGRFAAIAALALCAAIVMTISAPAHAADVSGSAAQTAPTSAAVAR